MRGGVHDDGWTVAFMDLAERVHKPSQLRWDGDDAVLAALRHMKRAGHLTDWYQHQRGPNRGLGPEWPRRPRPCGRLSLHGGASPPFRPVGAVFL